MNFFDGKLQKDGGSYSVAVAGAVVPLTEETSKALAAKNIAPMDVTVGVRPEHSMFSAEGGSHVITGKVDVSEMMGSEVYLHVNAGGKDVVLRIPTTDLPAEHRGGIPYGAEVKFTFRPEMIHLFNPSDEKNLLGL